MPGEGSRCGLPAATGTATPAMARPTNERAIVRDFTELLSWLMPQTGSRKGAWNGVASRHPAVCVTRPRAEATSARGVAVLVRAVCAVDPSCRGRRSQPPGRMSKLRRRIAEVEHRPRCRQGQNTGCLQCPERRLIRVVLTGCLPRRVAVHRTADPAKHDRMNRCRPCRYERQARSPQRLQPELGASSPPLRALAIERASGTPCGRSHVRQRGQDPQTGSRARPLILARLP